MTGAELIAAERQRQIDQEFYTLEHDDQHSDGVLVSAAAHCLEAYCDNSDSDMARNLGVTSVHWPEAEWIRMLYEKHGGIRALEIAGALIAAEIDRLQRIPQSS